MMFSEIVVGSAQRAFGCDSEEEAKKEAKMRPVDSSSSTSAPDTDSLASQSPRSAGPVAGSVQTLYRSAEGSRRVQDALDNAASDAERAALAKEMHGDALRAMRCPHGNHVLQKCICLMPPDSLQFMIDELMQTADSVRRVAIHRYGCRIIQQLLGKCEAPQLTKLTEALLQDAVALSCHPFGNYSIQRLIQVGTAEQQYRCVRILEQNMGAIAWNVYGVGVLAAALERSSPMDRTWIARAVLQDPKLLLHLAEKRQGIRPISLIMSALQGPERARACRNLMDNAPELRASRCGRKVVSQLEGLAPGEAHGLAETR